MSEPHLEMPKAVEFMTVDEVAETLDGIDDEVYAVLWAFSNDCENRRPQGGDGTDGTAEYDDIRTVTTYDDCMPTAWPKLDRRIQENIITAVGE